MTLLPTELRIAETHRLVEPALLAALDRLDAGTRRACGYHLGFWDSDGQFPAEPTTRGKGLRSVLAVLSAQAAQAPPEVGVPAAVACELVHNFSLLHDDVIDGDTERRHRPTVWARFGVPDAILAGDALLSLANEILAEADSVHVHVAVRRLGETVRQLIAGQAADIAFEKRDDVTLEECMSMAADKTAALLACSASLGAVLAGAPPTLLTALTSFGRHVGMAFQLTDDLLGIWGDPVRTGKPVLSDLRARKKSVPVVAALTAPTMAADELRDLYRRPDPLDEAELARAASLVEQAGGRGWTEDEADRQLAAGIRALAPVDLPDPVRDDLARIAGQLRGRST
ncbi:polyprenyl synthetase family protein [Actinopolymorpha singaporensis]|uniref:Geranylgeranyl diphosphate synthase, type I n=1 Tax=Actinopolymorpha singaporensis TaxID=117157 RepID=A0A1H1PQP9_9ACTN|nr:polyprenyl synthetase family protein [Actinopolymorpha singaporensis]SDS13582.1 geranylgeranyl diphosphate synthase, type I [Actinopolymorpha singaporensis]